MDRDCSNLQALSDLLNVSTPAQLLQENQGASAVRRVVLIWLTLYVIIDGLVTAERVPDQIPLDRSDSTRVQEDTCSV